MKVILQRPVDKLGVPGDVVEVADGYGRNFLIPRGLAAPASGGAERHARRLRRSHQDRMQKELDGARVAAEALSASPLRVRARAGEDGRLFGSITAADLTGELQGRLTAPLDRHQVHLAEPIRSIGTHEVSVRLHPAVTATVTVDVVPA